MLHSLLFGHRPFFHNVSEHSNRGKTDIYEQDDAYIVHTEVPGFRQEDIDVSATGNSIEIKAQRDIKFPQEFTTDDDSSKSISFQRSFRFRKSLDETSISAKVNHGLLEIHLPKKSATKIPVSVQ
jgi:HSP20 family protein